MELLQACRAWMPILLALCAPLPAAATTYAPMSDADLLDQSGLVALGRIAEAGPVPGQELDATRYRVEIEELIKGTPGARTIELAVPGSFTSNAAGALIVPDAPRFQPAERVLLFLALGDDGRYRLNQFGLGAFHVRTAVGGLAVAVRALEQEPLDQVRGLGAFVRWLKLAAIGGTAGADYWTRAEPPATAKFNLIGVQSSRWFEFDRGVDVVFYTHQNGQYGLADGGVGAFRQGISAWVADSGSNARYVLAGTTRASGGVRSADGVNTILFNDPNGELAGSFDCTRGGVVAYGGFRSSGSGTFRNGTFYIITEGDVVVQDGASCFLNRENGSNAAEVFAHELGHTLGLGHSCGDEELLGLLSDCLPLTPADNALMRATAHSDGRGARLGSDDRAAMASLYGNGLLPPLRDSPEALPSGPSTAGGEGGGGGGGAFGALGLLALLLARLCGSSPGRRQRRSARRRRASSTGLRSNPRRSPPPAAGRCASG